jgi:hypothetical protein
MTAPYDALAVWIESQHPRLFRVLLNRSVSQRMGALLAAAPFSDRPPLEGLGDYGDYITDFDDTSDVSVDMPDLDIPDIGSIGDDVIPNLPNINADDTLEGTLDETGGNSGTPSKDEIAAQTASAANPDLSTAITAQNLAATIETPPTVSVADTVATTSGNPVSAAASSVGSFLSSAQGGQILLATLKGASAIVNSVAAANVIEAQAQRAAAGLQPANVGYTLVTDPTTGQQTAVPVLNQNGNQIALGSNAVSALAPPGFLQNYGVYLIMGAAALALLSE